MTLLSRISVTLSVITTLLGLTGLCGWLFDSFFLRSFLTDGATMKVDTANMLIMSGTSLFLLNIDKKLAAKVILIVLALSALLILSEYVLNVSFGIDEWLFKDKDTNPLQAVPGRTSVLTAVCILMIATSMLLVIFKKYQASQLIAALLFLMVYAALLGHIFGVVDFYRQGHYSGIAFNTAFAILSATIGILLYQRRYGWVKQFMQYAAGRKVSVYLMVYLLCLAPLLVGIYLYFISHNLFSPVFGLIILVVMSGLISILFAFLVIKRLNETDNNLSKTNQRLEIALNAAKLGSYDLDLETGKMISSPQCKANFGIMQEEEFNFPDLLNALLPKYRDYLNKTISTAIEEKNTFNAEYETAWPDDSVHWIRASGRPVYNAENNAIAISGITYDITGQKEIETKKDTFISMVSHELKTPLTSLKAYVQLLHGRAIKGADLFGVEALGKIDVQINKMTKMINGFLDVSRLESGGMPLTRTDFDFGQFLEEIIADNALVQSTHIVKLLPGPEIIINADREKINHVLSNLISNAVKYSSKNKAIEVSYRITEENLEVCIRDQGLGIDEKEIPRLFDRFYRIEDINTKHISGFGIGLYLSSEIIKLHDGKIWAESVKEEGSSFYFSLPCS